MRYPEVLEPLIDAAPEPLHFLRDAKERERLFAKTSERVQETKEFERFTRDMEICGMRAAFTDHDFETYLACVLMDVKNGAGTTPTDADAVSRKIVRLWRSNYNSVE